MKKALLFLVVSMILLLAFTSCTKLFEDQLPEPFEPGHVHEFDEAWTMEETLHFHACECGARADYANHSDADTDGLCDGCGYALPVPGAECTVTVKATDENGKPFFGNTLGVIEGEDAVFDIMVGIQYTLKVCEGVTIVETKIEDGCKIYTVKVEGVTEDMTVVLTTEVCKHSWIQADCENTTHCELCSLVEAEALGHTYLSFVTAPTCTEGGYTTYTCVRCNGSYTDNEVEPLGHSYSTAWTSDEEGHWHECKCGDQTGFETHTYELKTDSEAHWYECFCGYVHNHDDHFYYIAHNESGHWKTCACGLTKDFDEHTFSAKSDEEYHWDECSCKRKENVVAHTFELATDENNHWYACACGVTKDTEAHYFEEKYDEAQHWDECSCGYKANVQDHSFQVKANAEEHWDKCSCGFTTNYQSHNFELMTDEYYHWYECLCGRYESEDFHDYQLKTDDEYHWYECSCQKILEKEAHSFQLKADETNHWQECSCGFVKDLGAHNLEWNDEVAATCGQDGNIGYYLCAACNTYFDAENNKITSVTIPATGDHAFVTETLDAESHWMGCQCGAQQNVTAHSFVNGACECGATEGGVLINGTINNAFAGNISYITNNTSYPNPSYYNNGGLKMNYVNQGIATNAFAARNTVKVTLVVSVLNENTKTANGKDAFTFYGLDVNGNVVATATLKTVVVGNNTVTLVGEGIVSVKVIMTDYPSNGSKLCNVNVTGLKVESLGGPDTVHTHSFTTYTPDGNATCTADGTKTAKCDGCAKTHTVADEASALGHNYTSTVTAPTCLDKGFTTHTCSRCNDSYVTDEVSAKGHTSADAVKENEVAPDCTTNGSYDSVVYCSECDDELSRTPVSVDSLGHSFTAYEANDNATCTSNETETAKCDRCDVENEREIEGTMKEHTFSWIIDKDATEEEEGVKHEECSVCHTKRNENTVIDKLDHVHNLLYVDEKNPTCTESGWGAYEYCDKCDYTTKVELPETGHSAKDAAKENVVNATCTTDGSYDMIVYCSNCDTELSKEHFTVDAYGHDELDAVKENEVGATCTADGSYESVVRCATCNEELSRTPVTVTAKGHFAGDMIVENEINATCTSEGSYTAVVKCSVCLVEISREDKITAKLDHAWDEDLVCTGCGVEGVEISKYVRAESVDDLSVGAVIIIAAKDSNVAMSTTQNSNNRGQTNITKDGNTLVDPSATVQLIVLEEGTTSGTYAFKVGTQYLYTASSSSNYLRSQASKNANASWKITISSGTASIIAQGSYTNKVMQYNSSNGLFACYASASQKALCIYVQTVEIIPMTDEYKAQQTLDAITLDTAKITEDKTIQLPTVDGVNVAWTLGSGNTANATLAGGSVAVALSSEGETVLKLVVTVTVGETTLTKEFSINVAKLTSGDEPKTEVTTTMNVYANKGTTGSDTISWTSGAVTLTNNKASSSTAIRTSDSDLYRIYAKSEIVVSATGMTKIVFTATTSSYATALKTSLTNAGYNATVSGNAVTVTLDGTVDTIKFTASEQIRINKIAVTYYE